MFDIINEKPFTSTIYKLDYHGKSKPISLNVIRLNIVNFCIEHTTFEMNANHTSHCHLKNATKKYQRVQNISYISNFWLTKAQSLCDGIYIVWRETTITSIERNPIVATGRTGGPASTRDDRQRQDYEGIQCRV